MVRTTTNEGSQLAPCSLSAHTTHPYTPSDLLSFPSTIDFSPFFISPPLLTSLSQARFLFLSTRCVHLDYKPIGWLSDAMDACASCREKEWTKNHTILCLKRTKHVKRQCIAPRGPLAKNQNVHVAERKNWVHKSKSRIEWAVKGVHCIDEEKEHVPWSK